MLRNISNDGTGTSIAAKTLGQLTLAAVMVIGGCMGVSSPADSPAPSPDIDEETELESNSTATEGHSTSTGTATSTDTSTPTPTPTPSPTPTPTATATATATPTDEEEGAEYNATQEFLDNLDEAGIEVEGFDERDDQWRVVYEWEFDSETMWSDHASDMHAVTDAYCDAVIEDEDDPESHAGPERLEATNGALEFEVDTRRICVEGPYGLGASDEYQIMSMVMETSHACDPSTGCEGA